ncbi:MAG: GNAT family N-acetyltransferase, partial [Deltaproteobacteria bacterium]|nr:GNAT family N-acetyltransferase [Deltaproteobacteria bacterium]
MISFDLSLKLARSADAPVIARMSRDFIEYGLPWRWTASRVESRIHAPNVNVLVARIDSRVAGFGIMSYGEHSAHLDLLAVAPEFRRHGVARQLLRWLEKCALVAGTFRIALEVRVANRGAQLFYEQMGYSRL